MINDKIAEDIEQLKKEVWYLKNNAPSGDDSQEEEDISETISAIEDRLDALEEDVETIETSLNVGENIDVIYDMRSDDSTINRTWTSGATYGKTIRLDFTAYTSIRIYASINGCEAQKVIKVANRKKSDVQVSAINSTFNEISYLRFTFGTTGATFQVGQYGKYTFDLNNNTFSVAKGSTNADFFMYRLEGIK